MHGLVLAALAAILLVQPLASQEKAEEERLVWMAFDPRLTKEFFQEMTTDLKQTMKIMGIDVAQTQSQMFVFHWRPQPKDKDQNWVAEQEITRVKMVFDIGGSKIEHDSAKARNDSPLADTLNALLGVRLRYTIHPRMEVKEIAGHEAVVKKLAGAGPGLKPLVESILNKDALMQMAEPVFAPFPTAPVSRGTTWKRESELRFGGIGTYRLRHRYTYEGKAGDFDRIGIVGDVEVIPGKGNAALPFTITKVDLKETAVRGFALFDRKKGRFDRIETTTIMEGNLAVTIGGMETTIELRQCQDMTLRTRDNRP